MAMTVAAGTMIARMLGSSQGAQVRRVQPKLPPAEAYDVYSCPPRKGRGDETKYQRLCQAGAYLSLPTFYPPGQTITFDCGGYGTKTYCCDPGTITYDPYYPELPMAATVSGKLKSNCGDGVVVVKAKKG
ncbi:hypothetical protein PGT21_020525 [Puccinia graminis f. sp. tritici]|nr:hypothetical protein PGT21_025706 [Puccinia graminis f. sp. tritici]KAA1103522.1 hypothetical protein PGT21_020525 [Puccinia graminis f. sp. tritici]KAA1112321.1 hypothetical protein PGTUg99_015791 [Puccinia graminis f. sp. tritici]KAA1132602.1 hypothetical protein PGTUg99_012737 [Puccinia graminis f. sp. tritici]